jgi:hypothetical protein
MCHPNTVHQFEARPEFAASESGEYFADQWGTHTMQELAIIAEPRMQQLSAEVVEETVRFMSGTLGCEPFFGRV